MTNAEGTDSVTTSYGFSQIISDPDYFRGITSKWFETYLKDRQKFISINGYNSECTPMPTVVPQGYVLGHLLFILNINDLNLAIKHCKVHQFTDDTNFLYKYYR